MRVGQYLTLESDKQIDKNRKFLKKFAWNSVADRELCYEDTEIMLAVRIQIKGPYSVQSQCRRCSFRLPPEGMLSVPPTLLNNTKRVAFLHWRDYSERNCS